MPLLGTAGLVRLGFGGCRGQKPEAEATAMPGKDYHPRPAPLPQPLSVNYLSEDYIMQTCYSELSEGFRKKFKRDEKTQKLERERL